MKNHLAYLCYIYRHKLFVFQECWKKGLHWRGLVHDLSKFLPDEWWPYLEYFYTDRSKHEALDAIAEFGCAELASYGYFVKERFDAAWLRHIHRNKHHWQWYVLREDSGATKCLPMAWDDMVEMLCDWRGAGKAQGKGDNTVAWYLENKDKMQLHEWTRQLIEEQLGLREKEYV